MTHIPEMSTSTWPGGTLSWREEFALRYPDVVTRSVGWLGKELPRTGVLNQRAVDALKYYASWAKVEDGFLGYHQCELCGASQSHGEFWVMWRGTRYVLPQMTLHYVTAHQYMPPEEFLHDLQEKWSLEGPQEESFEFGVEAQDQKFKPISLTISETQPPKLWWQFWRRGAV